MSLQTHNMLNPTQTMNMNPNNMIDSIKSLVLTMIMVKGTTNTGNDSSIVNTVLLMVAISFIDTFVIFIKSIVSSTTNHINKYITSKTKTIPLITNNFVSQKSSILIKIEPATKNPTSDAVIDLLTNLPQTKSILLQGGMYEINYAEEIEIYNNKLFAKMSGSSNTFQDTTKTHEQKTSDSNKTHTHTHNHIQNQNQSQLEHTEYGYIELYSYSLNMEKLRAEVDNIVNNYLIKISNKLGNNIYYFSEIPTKIYRDSTGQIDYSKIPETLFFSMKRFTTNRSFNNLFGKHIDIIRKRVNFFRDNKDWYDDKGVPYTLGIMVSGNPGSGKTSIIKCISNELKRHIINIHLSDNMTKSQLENLFYSEHLNILQNGKTETYTIPINKRIYVLEDIDCQCDIILDRESNTLEQDLIKENQKLKNQIEELKTIINDKANRTKVIGNIDNDKKEEISNQKITLSFILNLFDGILETPGRITIMTTNFIDKLDKAFTRPGRIDVISKFGFSDAEQIIQIIEHRYDKKLTEEQMNLIYNIHQCITPAEISRILFENFNNLDGTLQDLIDYSENYIIAQQTKTTKTNNEVFIQTNNIQPDNIQTNNIQSDNIQPDNIQTNNIQPDNIQTNNIQSDNIQTNNIQTDNLQPDKISVSKNYEMQSYEHNVINTDYDESSIHEINIDYYETSIDENENEKKINEHSDFGLFSSSMSTDKPFSLQYGLFSSSMSTDNPCSLQY
jgi:hypothetical protein